MDNCHQHNQLAGVIGGSGGSDIIPAVVQVFINHFILGMEPLAAVQSPRVYHEVELIGSLRKLNLLNNLLPIVR